MQNSDFKRVCEILDIYNTKVKEQGIFIDMIGQYRMIIYCFDIYMFASRNLMIEMLSARRVLIIKYFKLLN